MPLDFPNSPVLNATYTSGTRTWQWDGVAWGLIASGIVGPAGDWTTARTIVTPTITSNNYTLTASDIGKFLLLSNSSAMTLTVGTGLMSVGQSVDFAQTGLGQVTITASGTTINATPTLKLRARYSSGSLLCVSANTYLLVGDLASV